MTCVPSSRRYISELVKILPTVSQSRVLPQFLPPTSNQQWQLIMLITSWASLQILHIILAPLKNNQCKWWWSFILFSKFIIGFPNRTVRQEARSHLEAGKRHMLAKDITAVLASLAIACDLLSSEFGATAAEFEYAYVHYCRALDAAQKEDESREKRREEELSRRAKCVVYDLDRDELNCAFIAEKVEVGEVNWPLYGNQLNDWPIQRLSCYEPKLWLSSGGHWRVVWKICFVGTNDQQLNLT